MPYGLIAGNGRFPMLALEAARRAGMDVVAIGIKEEASPEIERLDLRRCFLFDADCDHIHAGPARRFQCEHREAAVTGDESVRHYLTKPRLPERMNSTSSFTSGEASTSAPMRSSACVVLRPECV